MASDYGSGSGQMGFGFGEMADRPLTREQRRSGRTRSVRSSTISVNRMTKRERDINAFLYPATEIEENQAARPKTRAECPPVGADGKRRCAWVGCKWHLYLDVNPKNGAIKKNFPDIDDPTEIPECCVLDVAERGGKTLESVAQLSNLTRERIRQLEVKATCQIRAEVERLGLREATDAFDPKGKRSLPVLTDALGPGEAVEEMDFERVDSCSEPDVPPGIRVNPTPKRDEAKAVAYRLVSFSHAEFVAELGSSGSVHLSKLFAMGYLERRDRGRYSITSKLENEIECNTEPEAAE